MDIAQIAEQYGILPETYYMNPATGTIALGEDWLLEQASSGWPVEELATLVEVSEDGHEL